MNTLNSNEAVIQLVHCTDKSEIVTINRSDIVLSGNTTETDVSRMLWDSYHDVKTIYATNGSLTIPFKVVDSTREFIKMRLTATNNQ